MYLLYHKLPIIIILVTFTSLFGDVHIEFQNVDIDAGTLDVNMTNDEPVAGFQFNLDGVDITGASGGSATANGFMVSASGSTVIGFSLTGATIPSGSEILVNVTFSDPESQICLANPVFSDSSGEGLETILGDCYGDAPVPGCTDPNASNFNQDATVDDGSCEYILTLSLENVDIENGTLDVYMTNPMPVSGFQFDLTGLTITDAVAGDIVPSDWMISANAVRIIGFSLSGSTIPIGSGTLVTVSFTDFTGEACFTAPVFSDAAGVAIDATLGDCFGDASSGCTDAAACNYNPDANEDDGSCDYGAECWDGSFECDEADCPDIPTSTIEVLYNTTDDIAGFQFDLTGVTITDATGGENVPGNWMISASTTTVIGFSLSGSTIPAGAGVLTYVDIEGVTDDACLDAIVLSDTGANPIYNEVIDCLTISQLTGVFGCMDNTACNYDSGATVDDGSCEFSEENFDCDGNCTEWEDCNGNCNGTAFIDFCGVCSEGNTGHETNSDLDCNGDCFGVAYMDYCGVCSEGNTGHDTNSDLDCNGDCFGGALVDDCGVCGGDGSTCNNGPEDCPEGSIWRTSPGTIIDNPVTGDSLCVPMEFSGINQSTQQAFYFFHNVLIDDIEVESIDWVGAYNDSLCVGARQWDLNPCGGGVCDVPTFGYDGTDFTEGYLEPGDIPTFKIWDSSENIYYDGIPSEDYSWANFGFFMIDSLTASNAPDISVSPDSLYQELETGEMATQTLTICNDESADLEWDLLINDNRSAGISFYDYKETTTSSAGCTDENNLGGTPSSRDGDVVVYNGKEYYLDGSGGECADGYELAPQSILNYIASEFIGLSPYSTVDGNCCILHRDQDMEGQDWGMGGPGYCDADENDCNSNGPWECGPVSGAFSCTDQMNNDPNQMTFCMSSESSDETSWLSSNMTSGTILSQECQDIDITFDATDLSGGDYSANIVISSNDPDESEVFVPVSLSVVSYGCTDWYATNYDSDATINDGSCIYPEFSPEIGLGLSTLNGGNFDFQGLDLGEIVGDGSIILFSLAQPDTITILFDIEVAQIVGDTLINVYSRVTSSNDPTYPEGLVIGGYVLINNNSGITVYAENPSSDLYTIEYYSNINLRNLFINQINGELVFDVSLTSSEGETFNEQFIFDIISTSGCTDPSALNYNSDATVDDGSCLYGPEEFAFNQSSLQAFYFVFDAFDIYGDPLEPELDWIALFNGEVCVGSREWTDDLSTDIPAMGDDGFAYSTGYLNEGDIPTIRVYDASEDSYYDAYPSDYFAFVNNGSFNVAEINVLLGYEYPLHYQNNLVSFYVLPEDNTLEGMFSQLYGNIHTVISEGTAAQYYPEYNTWSGSLEEINLENGYWIKVLDADTLRGSGNPLFPDRLYELHNGPNLISFPVPWSVAIEDAIPDDAEEQFLSIISEGTATVNLDGEWIGSLDILQGGKGYWAIASGDVSFSFNNGLLARSDREFWSEEKPIGFEFYQSTQQAFYFVDNIELDHNTLEIGDWILSYSDNVLSGSRQWQGEMIDIPVMGFDSDLGVGYCELGETPSFKLLKQSSGELINLTGDIPAWQPNGIFILNGLSEAPPIPEQFALLPAYPNPFNPSTTISFALPVETDVSIKVYSMQGREVVSLVSGNMDAGYHSVIWNADNHSSGVYFVKMTAGEYINTQKLMLVK